ncbi:hypothetical protein Tco_0888340, partial [Tanacetum coccineum]
MVINSPCLTDKKELAIPKQTTTGKEFSNSLMVGSLPKTICAKAVVISESSVRNDLLFDDEDGITCLTNDEIFENLALMEYVQLSTKLTFKKDASLVAAQDSDNIIRTQTTSIPNVDIPQGMDTGGSPRRQETMGDALAQTRSERVLEKPNEPPLPEGGYIPRSDEGRLKLKELMGTKLSKQVESSDDDLDEEDTFAQGRKSDKTKSMFKDSDFDILDDDMENVDGEIVNTATTGVSAVSAPFTTT